MSSFLVDGGERATRDDLRQHFLHYDARMYVPPSPRQREALLTQIVQDLCDDPAVIGVFVAGSLAAGTADAHSDIDLRVVVEPGAWSGFCADRLSRPTRWPGFLFNEWADDPACCVSHFETFGKVDMLYISADDLRPSPWLALPISVLHDPTGVIATARADSVIERNAFVDMPVDRAVGKCVSYAIEVARRSSRGELIYAQTLLDGLREWLVTLEDLLDGRRPGLDCSFRIEKRVSPKLREALYAACPRSDARELQAALIRLLPICRTLVCRLHEQSKLDSAAPFLRALDALAG